MQSNFKVNKQCNTNNLLTANLIGNQPCEFLHSLGFTSEIFSAEVSVLHTRWNCGGHILFSSAPSTARLSISQWQKIKGEISVFQYASPHWCAQLSSSQSVSVKAPLWVCSCLVAPAGVAWNHSTCGHGEPGPWWRYLSLGHSRLYAARGKVYRRSRWNTATRVPGFVLRAEVSRRSCWSGGWGRSAIDGDDAVVAKARQRLNLLRRKVKEVCAVVAKGDVALWLQKRWPSWCGGSSGRGWAGVLVFSAKCEEVRWCGDQVIV